MLKTFIICLIGPKNSRSRLGARDRQDIYFTLYEERNVPDRVLGDDSIANAAIDEEPSARDGSLQPSESVKVIS